MELMHNYSLESREVRDKLYKKRHALFEVLKNEQPDTTKIMEIIDELSIFQNKLEKITVRQILQLKPNLDPEKRDIFLRRFEENIRRGGDRRRDNGRGRGRSDSNSMSWDMQHNVLFKKGFARPQPKAGDN
jgi:hypothetical protein